MKLTSKILALMAVGFASANAATVAGLTFNFAGALGPEIAGGILVSGLPATVGQANANVGFFTTGFDVAGAVASNNYSALVTNFNVVASAGVGDTAGTYGVNMPGMYDTNQGPLVTNAASIGRSLYSFFTVGSSLTAGNVGSAYALVNSGQTVIADAFPPTDYTLFTTTGTVVHGQLTTGTFSAPPLGIEAGVSAPAFNLVPIPETSTALLGALGALGLLRRRRI